MIDINIIHVFGIVSIVVSTVIFVEFLNKIHLFEVCRTIWTATLSIIKLLKGKDFSRKSEIKVRKNVLEIFNASIKILIIFLVPISLLSIPIIFLNDTILSLFLSPLSMLISTVAALLYFKLRKKLGGVQ